MNALTLIFAHRGANQHCPENTMSAYKKAHQLGVDGIEVDVHLSRDAVPVLIHDLTVNRTTNGKGKVSDKTVSELKKLDAGNWFSPKFRLEKIPTLDEFLHWIKETSLLINIEIKAAERGDIEEKVNALILKYALDERIIVSSFNQTVLVNMKKINPSLETALLYKYTAIDPADVRNKLKVSAVHPHYSLISKDYVTKFQSERLKIRSYTVNDEKVMRKLMAWNIDGLITDRLETALHIRETRKDQSQSLPKGFSRLKQRMRLLNWKNN